MTYKQFSRKAQNEMVLIKRWSFLGGGLTYYYSC